MVSEVLARDPQRVAEDRARLLASAYSFRFPELEGALHHLSGK